MKQILDIIIIYINKINNIKFNISQSTEDIVLDPTNIKQLRNIYTFLQLLKSTLNLGLWQNQDDERMQEIVLSMFRILQYEQYYSDRMTYNIANK